MILNQKLVAEKLLEIGALKLNLAEPYTWASGWKSPIYCDNRKILSYPYVRDFIKSELCSVVFEDFTDADIIAGVASAGIPWGAMVADQLKLPYIYVRPKPKEHGLGNQIEGEIAAGKKVVVIEDLVSTGKSSLAVCEVLRQAGLEIAGMVSIFTYGLDESISGFTKASVVLRSLTNYETLISLAEMKGIFDAEAVKSLLNWRMNPSQWHI